MRVRNSWALSLAIAVTLGCIIYAFVNSKPTFLNYVTNGDLLFEDATNVYDRNQIDLKQVRRALEEYEKAADLSPNEVAVRLKIFDCQLTLGELGAARASLRIARGLAPKSKVVDQKGQLLFEFDRRN